MEHENAYASKGVGNAGLTLGVIGTALGVMNNGGLGNLFGNGGCNKDCGGNRDTGAGLLTATAALMNSYMNSNHSCGCSEDHIVNRYELGLQQELAAKDSRISLLESNIYVDSKIADVYERLNTKINGVEAQICQQAVVNSSVAANLSCMQNSINTLMGLTKTIIPIGNVCPEPMPQYNSWVAPTTTAAGA